MTLRTMSSIFPAIGFGAAIGMTARPFVNVVVWGSILILRWSIGPFVLAMDRSIVRLLMPCFLPSSTAFSLIGSFTDP